MHCRFIRIRKSKKEILSFMQKNNITAIFIDSRYFISKKLAERLYLLSERRFKRGENITKSIEIEFLLYHSLKEQIKDAMDIGLKEDCHTYAIISKQNIDKLIAFAGEEIKVNQIVYPEVNRSFGDGKIERLENYITENAALLIVKR